MFTKQLREWLWHKVRIHYECREIIRNGKTTVKGGRESWNFYQNRSLKVLGEWKEPQAVQRNTSPRRKATSKKSNLPKGCIVKKEGWDLAPAPKEPREWMHVAAAHSPSTPSPPPQPPPSSLTHVEHLLLSHLIMTITLLSTQLKLWDVK